MPKPMKIKAQTLMKSPLFASLLADQRERIEAILAQQRHE